MLNIPKKYQVDEYGNKTAVVLDIETYNKIEEILEKHCLEKEIEEQKNDIKLDESGGVYNKFG